MAYGDADLEYMIGHDFGVSATIGAVTKNVQLDPKTVTMLDGQVVAQKGEDITAFFKRGLFPALAVGVAAVVDGTNYTVVDINHEDASTTRITLAVA